MISINVYKQSNFAVNTVKVKKAIQQTLKDQGLVSDFSVSLAIVNDAKMEELVKKYYQDDPRGIYDHPVLTFSASEVKEPFVEVPNELHNLGEIVISYPSAVERANEQGTLVDEVVCDLASHGALHLAGVHH